MWFSMTLLIRKKKDLNILDWFRSLYFFSLIQSDIIGRSPRNYGTKVQRFRKYSTHDNRLVSSTFAWKGSIWCKTQDFSGIKKRQRKIMKGCFVQKESRGISNLSHLENALCSPIGRIARNFSLYILPSKYLKLSILLYCSHYLDTSTKMIHRALKMTHEFFIAIDPL